MMSEMKQNEHISVMDKLLEALSIKFNVISPESHKLPDKLFRLDRFLIEVQSELASIESNVQMNNSHQNAPLHETIQASKEEQKKTNPKGGGLARRSVTECPHTDRKHYSKGMCQVCYYHKRKEGKKPTMCPHVNEVMHSKGKCRKCYHRDIMRKLRKREKDEEY